MDSVQQQLEGAGDILPRLCLVSVLDYTAGGEAGRQLALCIHACGLLGVAVCLVQGRVAVPNSAVTQRDYFR